jgi:hypothetical protein
VGVRLRQNVARYRLASIRDLSTLYPRPKRSLVACLVSSMWARIIGSTFPYASLWYGCLTWTWSFAAPRKVARQGLGRPLRVARLLSRDLVVHSASQGCSAGPWWFAPSPKVARGRLSRLLRLTRLLGKALVVCSVSQGCSVET